jgi:hypothetical protein
MYYYARRLLLLHYARLPFFGCRFDMAFFDAAIASRHAAIIAIISFCFFTPDMIFTPMPMAIDISFSLPCHIRQLPPLVCLAPMADTLFIFPFIDDITADSHYARGHIIFHADAIADAMPPLFSILLIRHFLRHFQPSLFSLR